MTPAEIADVQRSFALVRPISDKAGIIFYTRLFEIAPSLRPMFPKDMAEQSKKLMQVLAIAATGLNSPDELVPVVKSLGTRHVSYGVRDEHYAIVGQALIWTLEQGLGDEFTPAVRESWTSAYTLLSTIMKDAARLAPHSAGSSTSGRSKAD